MRHRIPFDSLSLSIICAETQVAVGSNISKVIQTDASTVVLRLSGQSFDGEITISCDPAFYRMHLNAIRTTASSEPGHFIRMLRDKVNGGRLLFIKQIGFDRIVHIAIGKSAGEYLLVAHFFGSHSNLLLVSPEGRVLAQMRKVGIHRIAEPYQVPTPIAKNIQEAFEERTGISRILSAHLAAQGTERVFEMVQHGPRVLVRDAGAYAFPPNGYEAVAMPSLSAAIEQYVLTALPQLRREQRIASIEGQLRKALDTRKQAVKQMDESLNASSRSEELQMKAELLLAFGPQAGKTVGHIDAIDYSGNPIRIAISPDKTYVEEAERLFRKAKNAKRRAPEIARKRERMAREIVEIEAALQSLPKSEDLERIEELALSRRWLIEHDGKKTKDVRDFSGHRIKAIESPSGLQVLWGGTATANDYLTTRLAKGNDLWFHVRGHTSAHVLLQLGNNPNRATAEDIEFAAKVAARSSGQKHAMHVPVDFTFAKYVRKPRKSPPGTVTYSNEKTIFVDP